MFQLFGVQRCFDFEFMFFHKLTSFQQHLNVQCQSNASCVFS